MKLVKLLIYFARLSLMSFHRAMQLHYIYVYIYICVQRVCVCYDEQYVVYHNNLCW